MATKKTVVRHDSGYSDVFLRNVTRTRSSNYSAEMQGGGMVFPKQILEDLYMQNGFARLICDKPAEEMTRAGFEIEGLSDDLKDKIKSRLEELQAVKHFNECLKWSASFGGGAIVLGISDGSPDITLPVNEDKVSGVEFMRVYDRFEVTISSRYSDANDVKFGLPEVYQISPSTGTSYFVHESRILVIDGESVTNTTRVSNLGWGSSKLQVCYRQLLRLEKVQHLSPLLMERMQQAVHKIPGLAEMVADAEGEALVTKRVAIADAVRSAFNTVVIDGEEEYLLTSMTLSGVDAIGDRAAEALSAVSSVPVFVLMGRSVGGLNSSGDANKESWQAQVGAWQNDKYRKPLDRLISLLLLGFSDGDSDGGVYTIEFNPLSAPSDSSQADIDLKKAQTAKSKIDALAVGVNSGMMDQDEARSVIADDYDLKGDAPEPEEEPADNQILNPGQEIHPNIPGAKNTQQTKTKAAPTKKK